MAEPAKPMKRGVVLFSLPTGPQTWESVVMLEDGRLVVVKPEELLVEAAPGPVTPPKLGPGMRVKDRATGETGFVSELADDKAIVALDKGGFMTRALSELEPL